MTASASAAGRAFAAPSGRAPVSATSPATSRSLRCRFWLVTRNMANAWSWVILWWAISTPSATPISRLDDNATSRFVAWVSASCSAIRLEAWAPKIVAVENRTAKLEVGDQVPVVSQTGKWTSKLRSRDVK